MLSRFAFSAARTVSRSAALQWKSASQVPITNTLFPQTQTRKMGTVDESVVASEAYKNSCYMTIDFTIDEDLTVYEAVQRFSAYNVGCLVTIDANGKRFYFFYFF